MYRLRFIFVMVLLAFTVIWVRLFYWQVLSHASLQELADAQHFYRLEIPAARGDILAADGTPLASNQTAYLVFAEKINIPEPEQIIPTLAKVLNEEEASISSRFAENDRWVPLKHHVEEEVAQELRNLELAGIGFEREDKRYYPEASMAAHLLGFVGKNEQGENQGYFGLEGMYDKDLQGKNGFLRQERDAAGNPIIIGKTERIEPKNGRALVLHLDKTVQFIAEEELKKGMERFGAKAGTVVIMDPRTGGITASASYPSYDPSIYWKFPEEFRRNPVVADTFEPGSTFKPLIMAAAIDERIVTPEDTIDESGPIKINEYSIRSWNNEYHGTLTMTGVLEYSSNVGMVQVAQKMGSSRIISFLKNAGFGKKTGIDLQEETEVFLRADDEWRDIDVATVSFGQGIALTPIQMVRAIGAIANGGKLVKPQIVKKIVAEDGEVIEMKPAVEGQLYKPATAWTITNMMVAAVNQGVLKRLVPEGYRIAGKTGTAQVPVEGHYDADKTIASFVGFAPADDPKFVMLVTLREPETSPWGSTTAAPIFFSIAEELLTYYGISPQ